MNHLCLVLSFCFAGVGAVGAAEAPKADFYVSPKGNDTWSGTLADPAGADGPFATVARAQKAVREAKARDSEPRPYLVLLRGGAYMLPQTLVFTPEDSGAENAVIAYAAYPGETPILSGGRIISGWTQGKGEGELWQAEVPDAKSGQWDFHQLFVNGERRPRARTPNEGYLRTDGPLAGIKNPRNEKMNPQSKIGFTFKDANIKAWDGIEDVNLFVYHSWTASMHWIESVDEANRQVHFTNMSQWPISYWERRQRYVIENAPDALDSPGEWRLDRKTGILKYWPKLGEDMAKVEVVAPVLRQLIQFNGDAANQKFVQFIAFQGLSFQHADWQFPDKKTVVDGQASPTFAGAIQGEGAHHISFDRCEVAHVGEHAIYFHTDCQNNRIARCHLYDLGGGGAYIGQGRLRMNLGDKLTATDHNVVDNCFIHDTGLIFPSSHGVWIGQSSYNQVTHNEIAYIPYCGISVGFQWGYAPTTAHDNIIEFNHIHHIGLGVLSDLGAIYTLGISPGTRLGNNVLHDVTCVLYGGWGIYTDEGSSDMLIENNLVYDTRNGGFHQHYGMNNTVRNNIFAFSRSGQIERAKAILKAPARTPEDEKKEMEASTFTIERNIALCDRPQITTKNWKTGLFDIDSNLYWVTTKEKPQFMGMSFEEWQAAGHDKNSLVADPLFVDAAKRDFRLKPESPAAKIGFQPFDFSRAGLYGEKEWVELPNKYPHPPMEILELEGEQPVVDDFESTPLGSAPRNAKVLGEEGAAGIQVTDEAAAGGKHSLKFTDAPGLPKPYQPYMFYLPNASEGTARFEFDLRVEPGAEVVHEWRTGLGPYQAGPSIAVDADGTLRANDKPLMKLPASQWVHFNIVCRLGDAAGAYDLTATVAGQPPQSFDSLPNKDAGFNALGWLGFLSMSDKAAVFYLDNVKLSWQ